MEKRHNVELPALWARGYNLEAKTMPQEDTRVSCTFSKRHTWRDRNYTHTATCKRDLTKIDALPHETCVVD